MTNVKTRFGRAAFIGEGRHLQVLHRTITEPFALHAHDYFELEIILQGSGIQRLNSHEYTLTRGSVYLLSPADFHEVIPTEPIELWNISFDETLLSAEQLERIFSDSRGFFHQITEPELKKLHTAAGLLKEEKHNAATVRPLMEYLLLLLCRENELAELSPIRKAILYIETHFRESPSLAQTAAVACLSPVYFGSLFKQTTGETYLSYLNRRKVHCAKMLLENSYTVTEACFSSGFGSLSGFLYTFKQYTGMTPEDFRKHV